MCIEAIWPLDILVVDSNWIHGFVLYFDLSSVVHTVLACLWPIYYRRGCYRFMVLRGRGFVYPCPCHFFSPDGVWYECPDFQCNWLATYIIVYILEMLLFCCGLGFVKSNVAYVCMTH